MRTRIALAAVVAGMLAAGACGSGAGPQADVGGEEPPLAGTEWQLASYESPGGDGPVAVKADSTLRFDGKGHFSAKACNYIGGDARIQDRRMTLGFGGSTDMACTGEAGTLEDQVLALADGTVAWSIADGTLTLQNGERVLTYRVRPSIYPDLDARTLVEGDRAGGRFRLAIGDSDGGGALSLVFEGRTGPGEAWGTSGVAAPGAGECLASTVLPPSELGKETLVAAWATPEVTRVTARAGKDAPETDLAFYAVPGSELRVAAGWLPSFRPSVDPVTFYGDGGAVIAGYPDGPC
jgi:heat shock protein HslJ